MEPHEFACPNQACANFGRAGAGVSQVKRHGEYGKAERIRLLRCTVCGKVFSERKGTAFFGLKASPERVCQALVLLAEGNSLRATARILHAKLDTIRAWLRRAGAHAQAVNEYLLARYPLSQAQLDELWSFVKKNRRA